MQPFIFHSSIDLINPYVVWSIFGLSMLYLFITTKNKPKSFVSYIIILASITGIFEYISGFAFRMFQFFIYLYLWLFILLRKGDRTHLKGTISYIVLTLCYFLMAYYHGFFDILSDLRQYVIYSFPFLIYIFFDKFRNKIDYKQEMEICIVVFNTQIIAAILKLALAGFNEKLVGTISIKGGGIAALFSIVYFMIVWFKKEGKLVTTDYLWILASLIVPISSNKRAIWFVFPVTISGFFLIYKNIKFNRHIAGMLLLIPFVLYFGIRFNPSLNPEKRLWGSFNPGYVYNLVVRYNLGGDSLDTNTASGRFGSNVFYFRKMVEEFYSEGVIFGSGNSLYNRLEGGGEYGASILGFSSKFMLTGWVKIFVKYGTIFLFPYTILFLLLIRAVKNNKVYLSLMVIFLPWFLFYSVSIIDVPLFLLPFFLIIMNYGLQRRTFNVV